MPSPQDGATGVPRNTKIKVTFEPMGPTTINGDAFQLRLYDVLCDRHTGGNFSSQRIPATVSVDPTSYGRAWVLDPYGSEAGLLYPNKNGTG